MICLQSLVHCSINSWTWKETRTTIQHSCHVFQSLGPQHHNTTVALDRLPGQQPMVGNQYPCLSLGRNHHQASKGDYDNCNDGCTWRQWGIPNIAVFAVVCCQGKGIAVNYVLFKPGKACFMDTLHVTECVWLHGHTSDKDLRGTSRGELCSICLTCFLYHATSCTHHTFWDCSEMHEMPCLWLI